MPPKTQGYPWQLVHSTAIHGKSLQTLYRNTANLLLVKDMFKKVFGAFCSDPFRVSKYFYDAGETFLFSFGPDFQQYRWSGENSYFGRICPLVGRRFVPWWEHLLSHRPQRSSVHARGLHCSGR
ncbi:oxidation resistance protein 1-like [Poecilia formosa]|uniref:oxidation resistance protein 1-like n=2 Tax=Poecilia TaxID=8080 RepID=UPI0004439ACE|nr:PREDICTED: oxidation resistance protein 1-like [Poecilia formosa]